MTNVTVPPPIDASRWALFLDIDGTLLDIAPLPHEVVVPADLPPLLARLSFRLSGAMALISGRSLADIDDLIPGERDAAGTHGAEWRLARSRFALADARSKVALAAVERGVQRLAGVVVERKPGAVALHYRRVPHHAAAVQALVEEALRAAPDALRPMRGKELMELIPAGVGKGLAIERFMGHSPYTGRVPVFVGDDRTDEEGFETVNRLGGLSVHVGEGVSAARFRLESPTAVRCWLAEADR